jgi:hypothetical protein
MDMNMDMGMVINEHRPILLLHPDLDGTSILD